MLKCFHVLNLRKIEYPLLQKLVVRKEGDLWVTVFMGLLISSNGVLASDTLFPLYITVSQATMELLLRLAAKRQGTATIISLQEDTTSGKLACILLLCHLKKLKDIFALP